MVEDSENLVQIAKDRLELVLELDQGGLFACVPGFGFFLSYLENHVVVFGAKLGKAQVHSQMPRVLDDFAVGGVGRICDVLGIYYDGVVLVVLGQELLHGCRYFLGTGACGLFVFNYPVEKSLPFVGFLSLDASEILEYFAYVLVDAAAYLACFLEPLHYVVVNKGLVAVFCKALFQSYQVAYEIAAVYG